MSSVKDLVLGDIASELDHTRRLLECVPDDERFGWKPHEKSWPIGGLANHLAELPSWQTMVLTGDGLDLATIPPKAEVLDSLEAILAKFDENRSRLESAMDAMTDEGLAETWTLRMGDHELMSGPRAVILRQVGINHMAHHRGQMTVLLRLLDIPVPQTYGPTADDQGGFG